MDTKRLVPLVLLAGCLLPAPPAPPRYFAPPDDAAAAVAGATPLGLRLAPVRSPTHLREQMVWRRSEVEFGFFEQRRWTEQPAHYVERALADTLFAERRSPAPLAAGAPVVTVELRAFEEVLAPVHEARVEIEVGVVAERCLLLREAFAATRPLASDDPAAFARAIGGALDEVARAAGAAIRAAVAERRACGPDQ